MRWSPEINNSQQAGSVLERGEIVLVSVSHVTPLVTLLVVVSCVEC